MNKHKQLSGRMVALPESRQLDVLVNILEKQGATVLRCPLVAILDSPNVDQINQWLSHCIAKPYDDFVILTGEGIRRLWAAAERLDQQVEFKQALAQMRMLARGPKPGQALRAIGLKPDLLAAQPTTDGVITSLDQLDLTGRRIAVQLYGSDPNDKLMHYLQGRGALAESVAPYIYASDSDEQQVLALINQLAAGDIDAIAFTSQAQYKRLATVARKVDKTQLLAEGLANTVVAAIGPVMAETLEGAGVRVDLMPDTSYFMKPMVKKLVELFESIDN